MKTTDEIREMRNLFMMCAVIDSDSGFWQVGEMLSWVLDEEGQGTKDLVRGLEKLKQLRALSE